MRRIGTFDAPGRGADLKRFDHRSDDRGGVAVGFARFVVGTSGARFGFAPTRVGLAAGAGADRDERLRHCGAGTSRQRGDRLPL